MLKDPGNHIGDAWYYIEGDVCHCFYLTCPDTQPRHHCWDIAHATSQDLIHWTLHGIVLRKGAAGDWDCDCLSTGTVIRFNGRYWMAYSGKWNAELVQIGLAVSDDLYSWEKCSWNPVCWPDGTLYALQGRGERTFCHWRDPFLLEDSGSVYMLTCATSPDAPADGCGTLGICRSEDMQHWTLLAPIVIEPITQELECPQIIQMENRYILLFSSYEKLFCRRLQQKYGESLRQTSYYMTAESRWGPYRFEEQLCLLPIYASDSDRSVQYANRLIQHDGTWYLIGTVWSEAGDYIADPMECGLLDGKLCLKNQEIGCVTPDGDI